MTTALATLAEILRTTEKNVPARLRGLGLGTPCNRCWGTGHYSRNASGSTTCYRCGGARFEVPSERDLKALVEPAREAVAEGKLDAYLKVLAGRKIGKAAQDQAMAAWKENKLRHNWTGWNTPAVPFNKRQHDAYERVSKLSMDIQFPFKRDELTADQVRDAAALQIAEVLEQALAEIVQARLDFEAAYPEQG